MQTETETQSEPKPSLREKYFPLVREVLARFMDPEILKADCFNEAFDLHPATEYTDPARLHIVDIDRDALREARVNCPGADIRESDIRNLPYRPLSMDCVLDLSTIDHIPDPHKALREYARVLKPRGMLLLISWVYLGRGTQSEPSIYGGMQYFFDVRALRTFILDQGFEILDGRILTPDLVGHYGGHELLGIDLHAYLCKKGDT